MSNVVQEPEPTNLVNKLLVETQGSYKSIRDEIMDSKVQIERLLGQVWKNPYEVLLLKFQAGDDEIKRHYKLFSLSIHPDRCDDPKAKDAFNSKLSSHIAGLYNN